MLGKRCRKAEAVGEHVLVAGLAEVLAEVLVAIEDLAKDAFRAGEVDIAFFYRRAGGKPAAGGDVLLHASVVVGKVLLHQAVAVGAGPVEDVVRILIDVDRS